MFLKHERAISKQGTAVVTCKVHQQMTEVGQAQWSHLKDVDVGGTQWSVYEYRALVDTAVGSPPDQPLAGNAIGSPAANPKGKKVGQCDLQHQEDVSLGCKTIYTQANHEYDKKVYKWLLRKLSWRQVREIDCKCNSRIQPRKVTDYIFGFEEATNNPSFLFIDQELECLRIKLVGHVSRLSSILAFETFPLQSGAECNEIPQELSYEHPKRFKEIISGIGEHTKGIVDTYRTLAQTASVKLGVLPLDLSCDEI